MDGIDAARLVALMVPVLAGAGALTSCSRTPIKILTGGEWIAFSRISANDSDRKINISVGSNAHGDIVVVWDQIVLTGGSTVYGVRFDPDTGWLGQRDLSGTWGNVTRPSVAVDPAGNAVAAWKEQWASDAGLMPVVFWNRSTVGSADWGDAGPVQDLDVVNWTVSWGPFVTAGAAGTFAVAWSMGDAVFRVLDFASTTWGDHIFLSDGGYVNEMTVALDPIGNLFAAWRGGSSNMEWRHVALDGGSTVGGSIGIGGWVNFDYPPVFDPAGNGYLVVGFGDGFKDSLFAFTITRRDALSFVPSSAGLGWVMGGDGAPLVLDDRGRAYVAYRRIDGFLSVISYQADGGMSDAGFSGDADTADESMFDLTAVPDAGVVLVWLKVIGDEWALSSAKVGPDATIGAVTRRRIEPAMISEQPRALRVVTDPSGRSIVILSYRGDLWAGETRF